MSSRQVKTWSHNERIPLVNPEDSQNEPIELKHNHGVGQTKDSRTTPQRLLRGLGFGLFFYLWQKHKFPHKRVPEEVKVAVRKNWKTAALACSIHLIPVAVVIVLVVLNIKGVYLGAEMPGPSGQDDEKFIALQFAAKIHEMLMNASLAAVVFSYIRYRLASTGGLPFGALFAGFQFKDISFLWSMEFLGATRACLRRFQRQWGFVILILVCTMLAIGTGPSSATLMRPRIESWPSGGTDFWVDMQADDLRSTNVSSSQVDPSCATDTGDARCPYGDWQNLAQGYLSYWQDVQPGDWPFPATYALPGLKSARQLFACNRSPSLYYAPPFRYTVATIPTFSLAYAASQTSRLWRWAATDKSTYKRRFWSENYVLYNVDEVHQPVVHARCLSYNASDYVNHLDTRYKTGTDEIPFYDLSSLDHYSQANGHDFSTEDMLASDKALSAMQAADTSSIPQISWNSINQSQGPPNGLGAIVTIPSNSLYTAKIYSCTLDARMVPAALQVNNKFDHLLVAGYPQDQSSKSDYSMWPLQSMGTYISNNQSPQIVIDPDWAYYLDPLLVPNNSTIPRHSMNITSNTPTALQGMMRIAGLWNTTQPIDESNAIFALETVLSLAVVNGLARRDFDIGFAGTLKGDPEGLDRITSNGNESLLCGDWCEEFMPRSGHVFGYGGNAFDVTSAEQANSTKFTMQANINGYAYSARGPTARFALAILLLYTLIAVGHMVYTLWSGEASSSWDSISEMVALAMRSRDANKSFVNTGAGIDSLDIFKEPTQVVERNGRLELAVGPASGLERYIMVQPNKPYA